MWLSEKRTLNDIESFGGSTVGIVTIGGIRPSIMAEGELRNADIINSGAIRIPKTGDEMLLVRSSDGENVAVGKIDCMPLQGVENGEVYITNESGSFICIKNNGEIEISGNVVIKGSTMVVGNLFINGQPYKTVAEN